MIIIDIKPCSGDNCKSQEEIEEFYQNSSMLVTLNNQRYQSEDYTSEAILNKAEMR